MTALPKLPLGFVGGLLLVHWVFMRWIQKRTYMGPHTPHAHMSMWWAPANDIHTSLHVADLWSLSHVGHGICFYMAGTWILTKFKWLKCKSERYFTSVLWTTMMLAFLIEVGWELVENTEWIGKAYGKTSLFRGDDITNSQGDILSMFLGFAFAAKLSLTFTQSIPIFLLFEWLMVLSVRDNFFFSSVNLVVNLVSPQRTSWPTFYQDFLNWQCGAYPGRDCHPRLLWKREVVV